MQAHLNLQQEIEIWWCTGQLDCISGTQQVKKAARDTWSLGANAAYIELGLGTHLGFQDGLGLPWCSVRQVEIMIGLLAVLC